MDGFKTHKFGVYSAYYDDRNTSNPIIRVIGVTRVEQPENVTCRLYYDTIQHQEGSEDTMNRKYLSHNHMKSESFSDVPGTITLLQEQHEAYYHACYILCPLNDSDFHTGKSFTIPTDVGISSIMLPDLNNTYRLPIVNSNEHNSTEKYRAFKNEIGLCVKPIHSFYNNWLELVTFIELNKILGVSKFIVYNESMSENVNCVFKYYKESENLVSIKSWNLLQNLELVTHQDASNLNLTSLYKDKISKSVIQNRGVLAALNDCLYQHMYEYKYLFSMDLDEFIIPHMHDTIPEMLKHMRSNDDKNMDDDEHFKRGKNNILKLSNPNSATSYIFQNAMFYQQYGKSFAPWARIIIAIRFY